MDHEISNMENEKFASMRKCPERWAAGLLVLLFLIPGCQSGLFFPPTSDVGRSSWTHTAAPEEISDGQVPLSSPTAFSGTVTPPSTAGQPILTPEEETQTALEISEGSSVEQEGAGNEGRKAEEMEPAASEKVDRCRGLNQDACDGVAANADWSPLVENINGIEVVYVPPGEFQMGSGEEETQYVLKLAVVFNQNYDPGLFLLTEPVHPVAIDSFWIDRYEVDNELFGRFLNENGNQVEDRARWLSIDDPDVKILKEDGVYSVMEGFETHPVVEVTWYGARAYCEWMGGRLPTEAEWEYAARGPDGLIFPWGNELDITRLNFCDTNCEKIWQTEDYDTGYSDGYPNTAPVGTYPRGQSWCGAQDMVGNVWEWVADWMGPYSSQKQTNPVGPEDGHNKIIRGFSFCNAPPLMRGSSRWGYAPLGSGFNVGFRCAYSTLNLNP